VPYGILLAAADRLFTFLLFKGALLSLSGFVVASAVMLGFAAAAYRVVLVRKMVGQYPWRYVRSGLFSWRSKG
jgi:hypothetical protein